MLLIADSFRDDQCVLLCATGPGVMQCTTSRCHQRQKCSTPTHKRLLTANWEHTPRLETPFLTCCGATLSSVTLVGERRVLLGMCRVLLVLTSVLMCRVLAVGGVRGEVLLRVVGEVRRLAVVVLVVVPSAASRTRRVLVRAGGPGLLAGVTGHTHQTCQGRKGHKYVSLPQIIIDEVDKLL